MWSSAGALVGQGKSDEDVGKMLRADFAEFGASVAGARPVEGIRAEMKQ
jgi:hypothetical protein